MGLTEEFITINGPSKGYVEKEVAKYLVQGWRLLGAIDEDRSGGSIKYTAIVMKGGDE